MIGKRPTDENFPVASFLLPSWARPHIIAFYEFARTADDIADAPGLDASEKLEVLALMREQLDKGEEEPCNKLYFLYQSLQQTGLGSQYAHDLLKAFMRDAEKTTTDDWADLMAYCQLSAAPVGRYLIDLLGGIKDDDYTASDALCAALQVLNHIQDVQDDYLKMRRVYVPGDWMREELVKTQELGNVACTPQLRRVLDRMLDQVDALLIAAQPLPGAIRAKALGREAAGILLIAKALAKKLRTHDPLAGRVRLSKPYAALLFLWGALTA